MRSLLLVILLGWFSPALAHVFSDTEIQAELNFFKRFPDIYLHSLPPKKDAMGNLISPTYKKVGFATKMAARKTILNQESLFFSSPLKNDQAQVLMEDDQYIESIAAMDNGFRSGRIKEQPWSDDYWPFYRGGPAVRYADPEFPNSGNWMENYNYFSRKPFDLIFRNAPEISIDNLSPTEKYDLLLGPNEGNLTKSIWSEGEVYYREFGMVESWMGICHGWAPASYLTPRPLHSIRVMAHDNHTLIRFYPDDIKGLTSLLWAYTHTPVRFVGGRCNDRRPALDELGRPVNPDCLDTNPATWHLAVVNRVGINHRSLILDANWDYQIWNQPVVSYTYRYFNPKTMLVVPTLQQAMVSMSDFSTDRFRRVRSHESKSIVGITMEVTYNIERRPSHVETDDPKKDYLHTAIYSYDLEIDSRGNIVGGEWYKLLHPDFLWTPTKDSRALARNDVYLLGQPNWDGKSALSPDWKKNGLESARQIQPLAKIIESLVDLSRR